MFFLGLRPGPFFARWASLFRQGRVTFFGCPKKVTKKNHSGRGPWPHLQPSWSFPHLSPSARVAGPRAKLGACQQCRLKPPRKARLTHNPPGATRNSLEKHPSLATLLGLSSSAPISEGRGAACKTWGVSAAVFEANRLLSASGYIMLLECLVCVAFCQPVD